VTPSPGTAAWEASPSEPSHSEKTENRRKKSDATGSATFAKTDLRAKIICRSTCRRFTKRSGRSIALSAVKSFLRSITSVLTSSPDTRTTRRPQRPSRVSSVRSDSLGAIILSVTSSRCTKNASHSSAQSVKCSLPENTISQNTF